MRRTLMLDEDDLIMVVKEDIVKQIDKNRGEMNRTEFVNYLIQAQLKACESQRRYVEREEFLESNREMMEMLRNFLQFFVSYGINTHKKRIENELDSMMKQIDSPDLPDTDDNAGESRPSE